MKSTLVNLVSCFLTILILFKFYSNGQYNVVTVGSEKLTLPFRVFLLYNGLCTNDTYCSIINNGRDSFYMLIGWPLFLEDVNSRTVFRYTNNLNITLVDVGVDEKDSLKIIVMLAADKNYIAFFGGQRTCAMESRLADLYNKFMINFNCEHIVSAVIPDPPAYTNTLTLQTDVNTLATAVSTLLEKYGIKRAAILAFCCSELDYWITKTLIKSNVEIVKKKVVQDSAGGIPLKNGYLTYFARFLVDTFLQTRVYITYGSANGVDNVHYLLDTMARMGLLQTGEYFVISVISPTTFYMATDRHARAMLSVQNVGENYLNIMRRTSPKKSFNYYRSAALVIDTPPVEKDWYDFVSRVQRTMTKPCPPLCLDYAIDTSYLSTMSEQETKNVYVQAGRLYDALYLYATVVEDYISVNQSNLTVGNLFMEYMFERPYKSILGMTKTIDSYGNMIRPISVLTAVSTNTTNGIWPIGHFDLVFTETSKFKFQFFFDAPFNDFNWINHRLIANEPYCGFVGQNCHYLRDYLTQIIIGCCFLGTILITTAIVVVYKRYVYEKELHSLIWKIQTKDLILQTVRTESLTSLKSIGSQMMSALQSTASLRMQKSHVSLRDYEQQISKALEKEREKKKGRFKADAEKDKWANAGHYETAIYKGNFVSLKRIFKKNISMTRTVRTELKMMRAFRHENINTVIGNVYEPPLIFVVSEFCQRGALKDILENDDISLDNLFIASIVFDILKGLKFIHSHEVHFHGRLKSSNCLVDSKWLVKLSDFGFFEFRDGEDESLLTMEQKCQSSLWTAPEFLREPRKRGSQKGDIYSFSIILHEIFGRKGPFGDDLVDPIEAIDQLQHPKDGNYFRPNLSYLHEPPFYLQQTLTHCWEEDSQKRPTVNEVRVLLKPLQTGLKDNIFDNMLQLLEKYTHNLEEIVTERTSQLEEEKKKTEQLLLMMLPKTIAEQLKHGHLVEAEAFDLVTIFFSHVVGFAHMSTESTPHEIVMFLNDLYSNFDSIIDKYDVYKVETIGDSYIVVSGLPIRNGLNHAGEIASMSLHLLERAKVFKIRHRPNESLMLRSGIHSGTCVAGVVGLKMPRYCLFGDTVNTTSRIETSGEALKIHCSEKCKQVLVEIGGYHCIERGMVHLKGKGIMKTFWLIEEDREFRKHRLKTEVHKYPGLKFL